MAKTIRAVFKIVRGLEADLPILSIGELGYATDSNSLFIGDPDDGNVKINFDNNDREILNTVFDEIDKKINAEPGKGLSTNDLTNELLEKLLDSASENFVINKIAEAQLDVEGGDVDLSGLASKDDLDGKVDKVEGYSLISDTELTRLASVSNYDDTDIKKDIDKKADINHQHDQYLTSIPSQYVTNTQLTAKGYATTSSVNATLSIYAKSSDVPTKISQLTDDVGYLTSIPSEYVIDSELNIVLAPYALIADIPTKVSQLDNDKGYLTSIPEEYITETELTDKGYATTAEVDQKIADAAINGTVDLTDYALKTEVPTSTSQLTNDSNFLTAIPYEYVTESELENELINKVDKVSGKGLSTNDLTDEMVAKIDNAATQAYVTNAIAEAQLDGSDVDLSGLATKDELNEKAPLTHSHNISDISDLQTALDSKVDAVSGKSLVSNTEIVRLASVDNYDDTEIRGLIPTKVSQLTNDRNYLNSVPSEYVTETDLTNKGYATTDEVDQKIADAVSDGTVDLTDYALKTEVPTSTSQLTNDSNFLTAIPSEYVTESELIDKGYATTDEVDQKIADAVTGGTVDLTDYALKTEVPTSTSQLTNDSNFLTAIPEEYVTETELEAELNNKVDKEAGKSLVSDTEITRLASVANYDDSEIRGLIPTKVSDLLNDSGYATESFVTNKIAEASLSGGRVLNSLDNYSGSTLNDKMVALFNDINDNYKNTPMVITLPSGVIEITTDLVANGWTNKVFIANSYLYYNNCNAIEFIQCTHNNIYIHASSSSNLDIASGNIIGLITPSDVSSLTKRGYKITDCSYNEFKFNSIIGFTNAIEIYSEYGAKGCFYNNIYFTAIWRCQRPMIFRTGKAADDTSSQSGWITEIYTHGGMFDCDDGILIGQELDDRPSGEPNDNYQGLKFYNIGVEHVRKQADGRGFYFLQGKNNAIINPRFEGSMGSGNSTSGAYILVEESGYSWNNRIETSNYPLTVTRVKLNYNAKQLVNTTYDNPAGSYIEGDLYHSKEVDGTLLDFKLGYKAIATQGKMIYEAKNLSDYYLNEALANTFNYTFSDTEYAKIKISDGTIKTIGYTS